LLQTQSSLKRAFAAKFFFPQRTNGVRKTSMKGTSRMLVLLLATLMAPSLAHAHVGVSETSAIQKFASPKIVRFAGIAIVLCGGYILLS
jgi:hypothetical protein